MYALRASKSASSSIFLLLDVPASTQRFRDFPAHVPVHGDDVLRPGLADVEGVEIACAGGPRRLRSNLPRSHQRSSPGPSAAWVAMAPTQARAQGKTESTARNVDWTATPRESVSGSKATMEIDATISYTPAFLIQVHAFMVARWET
jgi:hypothetical protein